MMKAVRVNWFIGIILSIVGCVAASAFPANGGLSGRLLDTQGHALSDIAVFVLQSGRDTVIATTQTAQDGQFRLINLPPGATTIRFHFKNNTEFECQLNIRAGRELGATFIKGTSEIWIATHFFDYLDTHETKQVESFNQNFVEKLPLARTFDALLKFLPGVHGDEILNIHGASGRSNSYRIDGAEISSPFSGLIEANTPVESVEQLDFLISGYSPAEEADGGAIILVTTNSADNNISGNTTIFFENSDFPENIESLAFTKELRSYELSFAVGGPVIDNKLWFFGSTDYLYRNFRNNPGRISPQETRTPLVISKIDFLPADKWRITAAYHGSFVNENRHFAPNADEIEVREVNRDIVTADHSVDMQLIDLGAERRFSSESVISAGLSYFRQSTKNQPTNGDTGTSTIADFTSGESALVQGSFVPDNYREQSERLTVRSNFVFSLPHLLGRHELDIGIQYQRINMELQTALNGGYLYGYSTVSESIFRRISFDQEGSNTVKDNRSIERFSLNLTDRWQLSPNLAIEAGLTVDKTTGGNDIANIFDWISYAPRIAIVTDPFGNGSTAIRSSYARYYHRLLGINIPGSPYMLKTDYLDAATGSYETSSLNTVEFFGYDPDRVDPSVSRPFWDEFSIGIERRMNEQLTLSTTALYRKETNIVEDIETNLWSFYSTEIFEDNFNNSYIYYVIEPGLDDTRNPFLYLTNVEDLERNYLGVEFSVKAELRPELMIFGAYTWSRTKGNIDNTLEESLFSSPAYDTPNERINSYGYLSSDIRNSLRLAGVYLAPRRITIAILLRSDTGKPFNRLLLNPDQGKYQIRAEDRGSVYRTPGQTIVDLRLEKQFDISGGIVTVMFDVFNLADDNTVTDFVKTDERFGIPISVTEPRSWRWGVRYSY